MKRRILFIVTLIICGISGKLFPQQLYYPGAQWLPGKPEELKMNKILLDSAVNFALHHEVGMERDLRIANLTSYADEPYYDIAGPMRHRGGTAGIIVKNGYIVAKWGDVERVDMTFSVTKSYLSTIAGLAIDQGLISDIHDKVINYVWDGSFEGEHNSKITWEHLLNQTSDWSGCLFGMYDWADRPPREGSLDDWKNRKLLEPGSTFEYNDVRVNLLAYSLLQVWRKSLVSVLKERITDPIGASTTWRWYGYENSFVNIDGYSVQSVSGGGHYGGGLFISTLDQARFGLLFARNGRWNDKQIISERWIHSAHQPSPANSSYGYLWWTKHNNPTLVGIDSDIFYAAGFGGNYILIDQEHDLVAAVRWLEPAALNDFMKLVMRSVK
ncbi:MAG TPA: serine hydrolase [Cyclobacteriaceae bacterium]|nr:serine hydrolase [Cyclobacteriaceae bacterium]